MNTTFCMAPWVNIGVNPNGEYTMCCLSKNYEEKEGDERNPFLDQREFFEIDKENKLYLGSTHDNTLEEIWNNDAMRNIRLKMMKGEPVGNCEVCYYSESIVGSSERTRYNQEFFEGHKDKLLRTKPDGSAPFEPASWDLRLTNTCNFKCRDCCTTLSSSWEEESRRLNVDVSAPKTDEKDLRPCIRYNTNLSTLTYKGKDIIEYWKEFPWIRLFVSFDGIGKRGELIRKGFDSKRFLKNILRLQTELPHIEIRYNFVVYILNAYHFMDAHEFMVDNRILRSCDSMVFSLLRDPQYLRISILDSESRKEVLEKIENSRFKDNYLNISRMLKKEDHSELIPQFKFMTDGLDAVRNENTLEILPELHRLLK